MSWFNFKPTKTQEKEIQYKDLDEDETEHTIESENIDAFSFEDDQVDSDEGSED